MNCIWLHQDNNDKLLLFFNGWGGDEHPFQRMTSANYDVLMLNDYRDLTFPEEAFNAVHAYKEVHVVAWSFGVWVAQCVLMPLKDQLQSAMAINGTFQPVSAQYGIPEPIIRGTLSNLSERNLVKFQRRMLKNNEDWKQFESVKPQRSLDELENELFLLTQHFQVGKMKEGFYDRALIGADDRIIPTANQKAFWTERVAVKELDHGHFCFFAFQSWDEVLNIPD